MSPKLTKKSVKARYGVMVENIERFLFYSFTVAAESFVGTVGGVVGAAGVDETGFDSDLATFL